MMAKTMKYMVLMLFALAGCDSLFKIHTFPNDLSTDSDIADLSVRDGMSIQKCGSEIIQKFYKDNGNRAMIAESRCIDGTLIAIIKEIQNFKYFLCAGYNIASYNDIVCARLYDYSETSFVLFSSSYTVFSISNKLAPADMATDPQRCASYGSPIIRQFLIDPKYNEASLASETTFSSLRRAHISYVFSAFQQPTNSAYSGAEQFWISYCSCSGLENISECSNNMKYESSFMAELYQ